MNFFKTNVMQKLIALIVAIGCWFYVMNDQNPLIENTYTLPVTVLNQPAGYSVTKDISQAKITIKAPRTLFSTLDPSTIKLFVDLNHVDTGEHDLQLQTVLPSGFELVALEPGKVMVKIQRIEDKTVPVRITLSGTPSNGKVVAKTTLSMQNVKVQGPSQILSEVTGVIGVINVNGANKDNSYQVELVAVNDQNMEVPGIKVIPNTVEVNLALAKGLNTKIVDVKPSIMGDLPDNYILKSYTIDPDKIEISGEANALSHTSYVSTEHISLANITKPTDLKVRLAKIENISTPDVEIEIHVNVVPKEQDEKDLKNNKNN